MSNQVGPLYRNIIEGVIRDARADFEDLGEDPSVLEVLRAEWRKRLTDMRITGDQPWDDTEVQLQGGASQTDSQPAVLSQDVAGGMKTTVDGSGMPLLANDGLLYTGSSGSGGTNIIGNMKADSGGMPNLFMKDEPIGQFLKDGANGANSANGTGSASGSTGTTGSNGANGGGAVFPNDATAAMRAAQNIQQFANRNEQSGMAGGAPIPQAVRDLMNRVQNISSQTQPGTQTTSTIPASSATPVSEEESTATGDESTRLQPKPVPEKQQIPQVGLSSELRQQLESAMSTEDRQKLWQTDGLQDEEVNSDLDDSEDDDINNDEEDDGEQSQIMLCLYDKVQRVKNKWKYTLKDGVANVNGLDYVFSKATGESEW